MLMRHLSLINHQTIFRDLRVIFIQRTKNIRIWIDIPIHARNYAVNYTPRIHDPCWTCFFRRCASSPFPRLERLAAKDQHLISSC